MSKTVVRASLAQGGKRGELSGAALSEEALDSSRSVLGAHRGLQQRGLQQFYTPPEAAELMKAVIDPHARFAVLDPTAGNGALLSPWPAERRYGIEIDPDQVRAGDYRAITGDLQRAFPMLRRLGVRFRRIAANPPFGLDWQDGSGRPENSALATWRMGLALMADEGVGAFICGRDRFRREIARREDAAGVFATVECEDLFDGVTLPCLIAFFVSAENRVDGRAAPLVELCASREELRDPALSDRVHDALIEAAAFVSPYAPPGEGPLESFKLVQRELERRRREARRGAPTHDVELRGSERLSIRPCPVTRQALARAGQLKLLQTLHNQPVGHFALNALDWRLLESSKREHGLSIAPQVKEAVVAVAAAAEREVIPLYEVRAQMRLGYLTDLDSILCARSDPKRCFRAGERYALATRSRIDVTSGHKVTRNKDGEPVVRRYDEEAKVLVIQIAEHEFSESSEDISYLLSHFEVPNPGDIATRFPEQVEAQRRALDDIACEAKARGADANFAWKRFQREDLARALAKTKSGGGFILSWEQGGGKTIGAAGYALGALRNGARNRVLFIVPQDLIPQYRADIKDKLAIDVEHIRTPAQARAVARHLKGGGEGWYIVHYEALSLLGVKDEPLPPRDIRAVGADGGSLTLHSSEFCPACHASYDEGWQRRSALVCEARHTDEATGRERRCGYAHKRLRVKSAAHHLAHAFADGVVCIDEGTLIKGDGSKRSKAIRGMRARYRLLATGTPISNYVNQVFWLMWWCLGDSSLRFPYSYHGGLQSFESDFCVIEYTYGREGSQTQHRREKRRVLPQITNVSRFWRLSAAAMIRRRKRDFGEPIVPCTLKTVHVPMGVAQRELYELWLSKSRFGSFFSWKYPEHPLVQSGQIERFAAACGQLQKLEYATTAPEAATDRDWPGLTGLTHSNWTPKSMKTLEVILEHAQTGEKVLVGSDLIETGRWLCERLREKGVRAGHIVEERGGRAQTVNPKKRAMLMDEFRRGSLQVLLCGIPAIRLGHNLDTASVVVVDGLVFSYEMFDQFIARAHRLSSRKPVTVYVMLTKGSLDEKKWELLSAKGAAADLALDGQLMDEREEPISMEKVLTELQTRGVPVTGEEVSERELRAAWESGVNAIALPPRATPVPPLEPLRGVEQLELFAA
jgi:hypothetical protein